MAACLDTISSFLIYITALFCILFQVSPSNTGLAITNVLQLLLFVPWLVKMFYVLNGSMNSITALIYFGANVPQEARGAGSVTPPKNWPEQGKIQFIDVTSRYQRYGVIVLKNVNFEIFPKEKIAIVGRSGSGKSTILMSLLRILEPSEGKILIDEIDTKTITLTALRSRIAVVPQEPVMLTGTIRTNLDPFHTSSDQEIWEALKVVHLAEKIKEMPDKLDTPVTGI
jgi:ABC-type multidrug transport system fused ATPase/permease subunit